MRPFPAFIGPICPPMILWQLQGERGWPFHHPGGAIDVKSDKMRVIDLFSGIGGFSLGLERAGMETVRFCEIDPYCRAVLTNHWPDVPCHDDVTTMNFEEGEADVVCGGFPCQDISLAGKRSGLEGKRSGLFREIIRAVRLVRPRYAILENAAALIYNELGVVLGELAAIGYDAEWHCIPASYVGLPHLRDRVWIVAYPKEKRCTETRELRCGELAKWLPCGGQEIIFADDREKRTEGLIPQALCGFPSFPWRENGGRFENVGNRSIILDPLFRGSRDGVPNWVDRVGALGNAVVPQIPELIGRAILAYEATAQLPRPLFDDARAHGEAV